MNTNITDRRHKPKPLGKFQAFISSNSLPRLATVQAMLFFYWNSKLNKLYLFVACEILITFLRLNFTVHYLSHTAAVFTTNFAGSANIPKYSKIFSNTPKFFQIFTNICVQFQNIRKYFLMFLNIPKYSQTNISQ